jgi:hypothetical protein
VGFNAVVYIRSKKREREREREREIQSRPDRLSSLHILIENATEELVCVLGTTDVWPIHIKHDKVYRSENLKAEILHLRMATETMCTRGNEATAEEREKERGRSRNMVRSKKQNIELSMQIN